MSRRPAESSARLRPNLTLKATTQERPLTDILIQYCTRSSVLECQEATRACNGEAILRLAGNTAAQRVDLPNPYTGSARIQTGLDHALQVLQQYIEPIAH